MRSESARRAAPQLQDALAEAAARTPDKTAIVRGEERTSFAALERASDALAAALVSRGVARGDRVMVAMPNRTEAVVAFWGALKANAVVSVVGPVGRAEQLARLLNDCRATALLADGSLGRVVGDAVRAAPHLATSIVVGDVEHAGLGGAAVGWSEALVAHEGSPPPRRTNIDVDLAALVYTSGSTGEPKGVMLTHRNMITAASSIRAYLELGHDDIIYSALPLAFDYGLYQVILAAFAGATVILEQNFAYPSRALAAIARERATVFPGVPTMFALLGETSLEGHDLASVRTVTNTAAALAGKHIALVRRAFPRARLFSMYGLTECKRCTYVPPEDLDRKPGTVGIAIPNTEVWVVDEAGRRLGPDQIGELVVRGATVMKGYWEKPEATAKKIHPGPLPGETVLHTGDLCSIDAEGFVTFVARMDDVIKSRGEKVAPKEVENALVEVAGVKEAAVVGVPDELLGFAVKAFVVLELGAAVTEADLRRACQARLESFKVPKEIVVTPELPKTSTGKIKKTDLA